MTPTEAQAAHSALHRLHTQVIADLNHWRTEYRQTGSKPAEYMASLLSDMEDMVSRKIASLPTVGGAR